jgi:hypothetical protein
VRESSEELLTNLSGAVAATAHAKGRVRAGLRLAGDLRFNVQARPAAAAARAHLNALDQTTAELRRVLVMRSTLTAPIAREAWESRARRDVAHAKRVISMTDDIVLSLVEQS